jgi:hypothetical protein
MFRFYCILPFEPLGRTTVQYMYMQYVMKPCTSILTEYRQSARLFPVVGIRTPPTPHPQASAPPPPLVRGNGHTRWRERGWESPNFGEGTDTVVLCIYVLCVYSHPLFIFLPIRVAGPFDIFSTLWNFPCFHYVVTVATHRVFDLKLDPASKQFST